MQLGDQDSSGNATALLSEPPSLAQVAQTLAAHGGGALSADLALDLVLNDLVKQARNATGATGAAIALFRDGELTCRATSGENAPDLGVRVDATSGLAGACVSTGEIQQCRDTEIDTRVNADTCRLLGVRSMLMAPLVDGQKLIGVIQVFSAWPNAFGKREFSALQVLAGRIAESNREAEAGLSAPVENSELQSVAEEIKTEPIQSEAILEPVQAEEGEEVFAREAEPRQGFDLWGTRSRPSRHRRGSCARIGDRMAEGGRVYENWCARKDRVCRQKLHPILRQSPQLRRMQPLRTRAPLPKGQVPRPLRRHPLPDEWLRPAALLSRKMERSFTALRQVRDSLRRAIRPSAL